MTQQGEVETASTHKVVIFFDGIFQNRLATDPDPSDERRGVKGWTFSHTGESDLDRIIRFNNPVNPRIGTLPVGVSVKRVNVDGIDVFDTLIGKFVNLGQQSYFDGKPGGEDGFEPINNFEFNIGDQTRLITAYTDKPPRGAGVTAISPEMAHNLEVDDMNDWIQRRIEILNSFSFPLGEMNDTIRRERVEKILMGGWMRNIRQAVLQFSVRYSCILKNISYNPEDSLLVSKFLEMNLGEMYLNMDFFSYDGDGLVGNLTGTVSGIYI